MTRKARDLKPGDYFDVGVVLRKLEDLEVIDDAESDPYWEESQIQYFEIDDVKHETTDGKEVVIIYSTEGGNWAIPAETNI